MKHYEVKELAYLSLGHLSNTSPTSREQRWKLGSVEGALDTGVGEFVTPYNSFSSYPFTFQ